MIQKICIIGAGTMGTGIAQVAAQAGFTTLLYDVSTEKLDAAEISIRKTLEALQQKGKIAEHENSATLQRLTTIQDINECRADLFIEAIVEKTTAKIQLFNQLAELNNDQVIFASNTSSLSIADIQAGIRNPARVLGMHFFNPAPVMKLVEVVKGTATADTIVNKVCQLCLQLNKIPVVCKDAPGFIVNRVARHYYLEAMKMVELGIASFETVDAIMEATGFKMGPFRLMDLIGMDINLAVSESLYEAFEKEQRFKPAAIQIEKVAKGELGRKTGKGFYEYAPITKHSI